MQLWSMAHTDHRICVFAFSFIVVVFSFIFLARTANELVGAIVTTQGLYVII